MDLFFYYNFGSLKKNVRQILYRNSFSSQVQVIKKETKILKEKNEWESSD